MEAPLFAHPSKHCEVGARRGPTARDRDVNRWPFVDSISAHGFDLQSNHLPGRAAPYEDFSGLRVWKWPEKGSNTQLQRAGARLPIPPETKVARRERGAFLNRPARKDPVTLPVSRPTALLAPAKAAICCQPVT